MNTRPISLRRRVALGFTVLGFLLSALFAVATIAITEDYEHVLAAEILRGQAEDYSLRLSTGSHAELPRTHRLSGYLDAEVPARYASFATGVSEAEADDGIHVGVFDTSSGRLTFVIDLRDIEELEQHLNLFLAAMVVIGTAFSGWLGWLLAGATLSPLARLADAVGGLPVEPKATRLQDAVSHDELGRLAGAIDAYQARLVEADAREQAFFADASHELRTPIAVVQGAAEVLLDDAGAGSAQAERLQRLARGMQELTELIETMFWIARRSPLRLETVDFAELLADAVAMALPPRAELGINIDAAGEASIPKREALSLLGSLLRRMVPPHAGGTMQLRARDRRIDLEFQGDGVAMRDGQRSDTGTTPMMAMRLAERMGWALDSAGPGRIRIRIP